MYNGAMGEGPSSAALCKALNARVEDLRRLVPRAMKSWDRDAIHQARVTTRRVKAAIDLVDPLLTEDPKRRFTRLLRRLRRTLGPLRDLDVMLGHLQELARQKRLAPASAWLSRRLQQKRLKLRRKCVRKNPTEELLTDLGGWWGLEHEVSEAQGAARSLLKRAASIQLKSLCDKATRLAGAGGESVPTANEDVHALRIAAKLLRYTLELAEPLGYELPQTVLRSFKKLQDALGLWHDFIVLGEAALEAMVKDHLALHDSELYAHSLRLVSTCLRKSQTHLRHFMKLWAKDAEALEQQVRRTFQFALPAPAGDAGHGGNGARHAAQMEVVIPQLGACEK